MKICPKCNKKYSDEALNFCLEDGSVLTSAASAASINEPPPTVMVGQPQQTTPNQPFGNQPNQPQTWDNSPRYQSPGSGSSSKTWLWAIGIIALVMVLCGGGFIGLALIIPSEDDDPVIEKKDVSSRENKENPVRNEKDDRELKGTIDLSEWDIQENEFISSESKDGNLILTSKKGFYYVILTKNVKTYNTTILLTVKNLESNASDLGYGLVVHSHPTQVLSKDYAFLIRSDKRQYRIVRHTDKKETNIVDWTLSTAIKSGSQPNVIEVRVNDGNMSLYINDEFITTVKDETGYKNGVAGIYTSDDIPIAFQTLKIRE